MAETRTGKCLCGAVSYSVIWPPAMTMACHCKDCQRQAGTILSVISAFPMESVTINGTLKTFHGTGESGGTVLRKFCGECGSPVLSEIPQAQFASMYFIKAGTLDDTSGVTPSAHLWTSSAQDWFPFPEGAVKVEKQ